MGTVVIDGTGEADKEVDRVLQAVVNPTAAALAELSEREVGVMYLGELKELNTKVAVMLMQALEDVQKQIVSAPEGQREFSDSLIKFVIEGRGEEVRYQLEFRGELAKGIATLFNLESTE